MNDDDSTQGCVVAAHSDGIRVTVSAGVLTSGILAIDRGYEGEWVSMVVYTVVFLLVLSRWVTMPAGARVIGPKRCGCAKHRRRALRRARREGGTR